MKNKIFKTGLLILSFAAFASCDDAKYQEIENGLYINEASPAKKFNKQVENLTITEELTTTAIHARLAQPVDHDVHITFALADDFLSEYNSTYGTEYVALSSEYLSFDTEAVIPAGSVSSDAVNINIKKYPTGDGIPYCVPIKIASSDADVDIMQDGGHLMYLLTAPLVQKVPGMVYSTMPKSSGTWGIATSEWTLEGWINMGAFPINNQAIFNVACSKGTEIYVRFGDANIPFDQLQIKTGGSQWESKTIFAPNTWYHIAITYSSGKATLYVNGVSDSEMDITADYVLDGLQLCSSGIQYFRTTGKMAQIRFWKKALSAAVIKDAMNREVPANSEGLFGYWKLNEGEGDVFKDATASGFDLTCEQAPTWYDAVNFSDPNKKVE